MGANKVVTYRRIYALFRKKKKEIGDEIYMRENFDIPDRKKFILLLYVFKHFNREIPEILTHIK